MIVDVDRNEIVYDCKYSMCCLFSKMTNEKQSLDNNINYELTHLNKPYMFQGSFVYYLNTCGCGVNTETFYTN